ncbi:hypothetical protein EKO04_000074 [Ascochyta lentis]|uniref:Uncharacterized protein n=1 Tax=Ascochyta lentis TaxID=205686 RepID=A0A8H7JCF3_9PLEO|nr:hypothetical protein EKO04_000074 [Ascochyta lentis]
MTNTTTTTTLADVETKANWAFTALSTLDTWCGSSCHAALRCWLQFLLLVVLVGAFMSVVLWCLGLKRRMALSKSTGLDSARRLLDKSDMESVVGAFRDSDAGAEIAKARMVDGGPDVKDSCVVL